MAPGSVIPCGAEAKVIGESICMILICSQMGTLLTRAEECAKKANTDVSFRRPDRAYVEWLISSDIILDHIPRHRDYPTLNKDRGPLHQRYRQLYKVGLLSGSDCPETL